MDRATRAGYAAAAFGHIGQLPQILKGFEIASRELRCLFN
jgi:hypothetical protein